MLTTDTLARNDSGQTDGSLELLVPLPAATRIWEGDGFERPYDLVVSSDDRVFFVGELNGGSIWELNRATGFKSLVVDPSAFLAGTQFGRIAVAPGGDLLMAGSRNSVGKIFRIDPDDPQPVEIVNTSGPVDIVKTSNDRVFVSGSTVVSSGAQNDVVGALYKLNLTFNLLTLVAVGQVAPGAGSGDRDLLGNFSQELAVDALDRILISTGFAGTGCGFGCDRWVVRYDPSNGLTQNLFDGGGSTLAVLPNGEVIFAGSGAGIARFDTTQSQVVSYYSSPQPDSRFNGLWVMERDLVVIPAPEPASGLLFGLGLLGVLGRRRLI